jgi:hypothetical protein
VIAVNGYVAVTKLPPGHAAAAASTLKAEEGGLVPQALFAAKLLTVDALAVALPLTL